MLKHCAQLSAESADSVQVLRGKKVQRSDEQGLSDSGLERALYTFVLHRGPWAAATSLPSAQRVLAPALMWHRCASLQQFAVAAGARERGASEVPGTMCMDSIVRYGKLQTIC